MTGEIWTVNVSFHVAVPADRTDAQKSRVAAIARRDEIIEALKPLGIRLSVIDDGLDVWLADAGVPTIAEAIAAESWQLKARRYMT